MNKTTLRLESVTAGFDSHPVVFSASFEARSGEIHFILGPNASGKTTLLSTIAGLPRYRVLKGSIVYLGEDITGWPAWVRAARGIALAHQLPPPMRYVKGRVLVEELAKKYKTPMGRVSALAERLKVNHLLDRNLFRNMSGGERKRLELFLALLQNPKLLLLDEPDSGVDLDTLSLISSVIVGEAKKGVAVIVVSHTPLLAEKIIEVHRDSYAHVLYRGRIVYEGFAEEVFRIVEKKGYEDLARRALQRNSL